MARKAFYSFHYKPDNWRADTSAQHEKLEGNAPCSDNDWGVSDEEGRPCDSVLDQRTVVWKVCCRRAHRKRHSNRSGLTTR